MSKTFVLIELYSPMPTNKFEDCKMAGEFIKTDAISAIKVIGFLIEQNVEFVVWEIGECLVDLSYDYFQGPRKEVNATIK
jgi:hypothetical protein